MRRCALLQLLATILAGCLLLAGAGTAAGAASDPLFVFSPIPPKGLLAPHLPPPYGDLNGPCGVGVESSGNYYVSDYYRGAVDVFTPDAEYSPPPQFGAAFYIDQLAGIDPLDGPCGLALDAADNLYVNDYHRAIIKYGSRPNWGPGAVIAGAGVDESRPTGVAVDPASGDVYVDARTHVAVYDSSGAPVTAGGEPLKIGFGSAEDGGLQDGYGLAYSSHPGTLGRLYVADATTDTVKVYDPAVDQVAPVAEIDGSGTPNGRFVSLRDSALAVDRVTGELYVIDNLEPDDAEKPDAIVYVFAADGSYEGHLKYLIRDALPPGLAVDNTAAPTYPLGSQGRVYVTSGNTTGAAVYGYPPGAATTTAPKPTAFSLQVSSVGSGAAMTAAAAPANSVAAPGAAAVEAPRAASETQQKGSMLLNVSAALAPKRLPRDELSPVAVSLGWNVSTTDGSEPPKLKAIGIEINRNGVLETEGIPPCPYGRIQPASTSRALANCRASLVGQGSFSALVGLEGQDRYKAKGKMLVFSGREKGKPVLYGQIYSSYPFANSFVIVFKVKAGGRGTYGTKLTAQLPARLRDWGNLTQVDLRLSRRYSFKGKPSSFLAASCPTPKGFGLAVFPLARTSFSFADGTNATSTLTETCKVSH